MTDNVSQGKGREWFIKRSLLVSLLTPGVLLANMSIPNGSGAIASKLVIATASAYSWERVTERAPFPGGYNYPVFVAQDRMWAFHQDGIWNSADGKTWAKTSLPSIRHNVYVTQYIPFKEAIFALGQNQGNYLDIKFGSTIRRTTDFQKWETLAEKSNLPDRIFYGLVVFKDKIWLLGGYDGKRYHNDIWNSSDGVNWVKVTEHSAWTPRTVATTVVFKDRIWVIGGGVIDGQPTNNKNEEREIWSSADGISWMQVTDQMPSHSGGSPIVFDGKLWLVGANRDGTFAKSSLITNDGVTWDEEAAPWSPRGGSSTWVFNSKLFITGGKFSVTEKGKIRFIYSNDVWYMVSSAK